MTPSQVGIEERLGRKCDESANRVVAYVLGCRHFSARRQLALHNQYERASLKLLDYHSYVLRRNVRSVLPGCP